MERTRSRCPKGCTKNCCKRCTKKRFRDEIAAKIALSNIVRKDKSHRSKTEKRAYPCGQCRGWHLTSKK